MHVHIYHVWFGSGSRCVTFEAMCFLKIEHTFVLTSNVSLNSYEYEGLFTGE